MRRSHYGWWPHMVYTKDLETFEEFTPHVHKQGMPTPPLFFPGFVKISNRNQQMQSCRAGELDRKIRHLEAELKKLNHRRRLETAATLLNTYKDNQFLWEGKYAQRSG